MVAEDKRLKVRTKSGKIHCAKPDRYTLYFYLWPTAENFLHWWQPTLENLQFTNSGQEKTKKYIHWQSFWYHIWFSNEQGEWISANDMMYAGGHTFVLPIQEEPPCGRKPLEHSLLPMKQGVPLWSTGVDGTWWGWGVLLFPLLLVFTSLQIMEGSGHTGLCACLFLPLGYYQGLHCPTTELSSTNYADSLICSVYAALDFISKAE